MIRSAALIYFSPTGTTKKYAHRLCASLGITDVDVIDLTRPSARLKKYRIDKEFVIIGAPVYEEYLPEYVLSSVGNMEFQNQPVFAFAVYGNIGFGVSLLQYHEELRKKGLRVCGLGAFIGEHSFSRKGCELADGRPDIEDINGIGEISKEITTRLGAGRFIKDAADIPGNLPLMARILPKGSAKVFTKTPSINDRCSKCGACVMNCPVSAINNELEIDDTKCIRCFACVKKCAETGRVIRYRYGFLINMMFTINNKNRKKNILI